MKHLFLSLSLLAALGCYVLPAAYADSATKDAKAGKAAPADKKGKKDKKAKGKAAKVSGAVGEYMNALTEANMWVGEKPAADAEFYIFLTSASWCGPCRAEMPHVVEEYAKMRENGRVELILMSGDSSQEAAVGYAEMFNATFPVINPRSLQGQLPPGYTAPQGIPNAIIVDKDGNVIRNGHGSLVQQWAAMTVENPDYSGKNKGRKPAAKGSRKKKK